MAACVLRGNNPLAIPGEQRQRCIMKNRKYIRLACGTVITTNHPDMWNDGTIISAVEGKKALRSAARSSLLEWCPKGTKVMGIVRSVSRSGMTRRISLYVIVHDEIVNISRLAGIALEWPVKDDSVGVGGCGMDMVFHTVYSLSQTLHDDSSSIMVQ